MMNILTPLLLLCIMMSELLVYRHLEGRDGDMLP